MTPGSGAPLAERVDALDPGLFTFIEPPMVDWDRRALLALHAATAGTVGEFDYIEIGSFMGGSLQALVRDSRCRQIVSIDPRTGITPDQARGSTIYEANTVERMLDLLGAIPGADLDKVISIEASTSELTKRDVTSRPSLAFVDGEHTDEAVLRDARFCLEVMAGRGVIAFHDYHDVAGGIAAFMREARSEIVSAVGYPALVFALEVGTLGVLDHAVIARSLSSRWHAAAFSLASRVGGSAPITTATRLLPPIDRGVARVRRARVPRRR